MRNQVDVPSNQPGLSSSTEAAYARLTDFKDGPFPKDDAHIVIEHYDQFRDRLLAVVECVSSDLEAAVDSENWFIHTFAMFLLASKREKALFPLVIRILDNPWELVDPFFGDGLTEDLARQLASVFDGDADAEALKSIAANRELDPFLRATMIEAFVVLYRNNIVDRAFFVQQLLQLFDRLAGDTDYAHFAVARVSVESYAEELFPRVKMVFKNELKDYDQREIKYYLERMERPREEILARFYADRHLRLISDPVEEMSWWYCFHDKDTIQDLETRGDADDLRCPDCGSYHLDDVHEPYIRTSPKVGRNEPCPCGSGKKFKKCCGS